MLLVCLPRVGRPSSQRGEVGGAAGGVAWSPLGSSTGAEALAGVVAPSLVAPAHERVAASECRGSRGRIRGGLEGRGGGGSGRSAGGRDSCACRKRAARRACDATCSGEQHPSAEAAGHWRLTLEGRNARAHSHTLEMSTFIY